MDMSRNRPRPKRSVNLRFQVDRDCQSESPPLLIEK
jgi:hypothetical protein